MTIISSAQDPTDRHDHSLYSLVSAAALASLLIWILSLPSVTATKTEPSKPRVISQMESSLLTQSRL